MDLEDRVEAFSEAGAWCLFSTLSVDEMEAYSGRREAGWVMVDGIFPAVALSPPLDRNAELLDKVVSILRDMELFGEGAMVMASMKKLARDTISLIEHERK